ncbi:MAG: hypothetical protein PVJ49_11125, partial [Acidobacteriota bacterium]
MIPPDRPPRGAGNGPLPRLAQHIYALSLRAYPAAFRRDVGEQMRRTFADRIRAAGARGRLRLAATASRGVLDSLVNGIAERLPTTPAAPRTPQPPGSPPRRFPMSSLLGDCRRAARRLRRAPLFTVSVVLTVAVGVGAFVSVYSMLDNVLWEAMPYKDPENLAYVWRDYTWADFPRGWAGGIDVVAMREQTDAFEGVAALRAGSIN